MDALVLFGVILALALNFVNGLNDASHSIATVVATRALSPAKAVFSTAFCNLIGPFLFSTAVAVTIGTAIVGQQGLTPYSIIIAMGSAIFLVFVATRSGIPISSSHAMVGGLLGAAIAAAGLSVIILPSPAEVDQVTGWAIIGAIGGAAIVGLFARIFDGDVRLGAVLGAGCGVAVIIPVLMVVGVLKITGLFAIVLFIFISPVFAMTGAFLFDIAISQAFNHSRQNRMKRIFQPLQVAACFVQATTHGANDGQHAVGIITALLLSAGILSAFDVPFWVIVASASAMALGTCFGGWNVIDKMAKQITKIRPYQGFCAATVSSAILVLVTGKGIPVSSTHAINGAIIGVGATRGKNAVQWRVVREMMTAWIITIPLALVCSFGAYYLVGALVGFIL